MPGNQKAGIELLADFLKTSTEPTLIIGNKGFETGLAVTIVTSKNDHKFLDGIFIKGYTGTRSEYKDMKTKIATIGLGVGKSLKYKKNFRIGIGVYATKPVKDFFNTGNLNIGAGISIKF